MSYSFRLDRRWFLAGVLATISLSCLDLAPAQPPSLRPQSDEGPSVNDPQAFQGYSLVAPMNSMHTYLIDMEGRVVNQWESEFTPGASAYLLENGHLLRTGTEPGGSIGGAAAGGRIQEFSWDGELLWDYSFSTERNRPHHDICAMPNGNVLVIAWDKKTADEAVAAGRIPQTVHGQFLPDCIFEVRPTGKNSGEIVWEWHAWDHLIQELDEKKPNYGEVSEHPELIDINFGTNVMASMINDPEQLAKLRALGYVGGGRDAGRGQKPSADDGRGPRGDRVGPGPLAGPGMVPDWMHTNSVDYHPELDQIMLSIHEFSEVWIIDHSTTTQEAASHNGGRYGMGGDLLYRWGNPRAYRNGTNADQRLFAQHCAHWIPKGLPGEGHMLVFNNGNGRPDGMYSSVDEVVLPVEKGGHYVREEYLAFGPERAAWSYFEPDQGSFFSMNISGAQRLPNGNTFICSGAAGILFEVTPAKETVWKYATPNPGWGGPGGPGGTRHGDLFPSFLQDVLRMTDVQKAKLSDLQKQVATELAEILTDEQRKRLENPMPFNFGGPPPGRGPRDGRGAGQLGGRRGPGGAGRPGGPMGFTPPRPGEVVPSMWVESLKLSTSQSLQLDKLQEQVDAQIAAILTPAQQTQLDEMQRMMARGPGAGPPSFGPPGFGPPGFGPSGFGPPGFGPVGRDGNRPDRAQGPDGQREADDRAPSRPVDGPGGPGFAGGDRGPGRPDVRRGGPGGQPRGGPGGGPGGPGGGPGGPGGIFTCYRYGPEYPGLVGKDLTPGQKLVDLLGGKEEPRRNEEPR